LGKKMNSKRKTCWSCKRGSRTEQRSRCGGRREAQHEPKGKKPLQFVRAAASELITKKSMLGGRPDCRNGHRRL